MEVVPISLGKFIDNCIIDNNVGSIIDNFLETSQPFFKSIKIQLSTINQKVGFDLQLHEVYSRQLRLLGPNLRREITGTCRIFTIYKSLNNMAKTKQF